MMAGIGSRCAARLPSRVIMALLAVWMLVPGSAVRAATGPEAVPYTLKQELFAPVQKWIGELGEEKNKYGKSLKKGVYSRTPHKVDDNTYTITVHVNTSQDTQQLTERYLVTLKRDAAGKSWTIADKALKESYVGLYRSNGAICSPFQKLNFDREGMKITGTNGTACETFLRGRVVGLAFQSSDLKHEYSVPEHAVRMPTGHDFYAMQELLSKDHSDQLAFKPTYGTAYCDVDSCDELAEEIFTGFTRTPPEQREKLRWEDIDLAQQPQWLRKAGEDVLKARKEDAFSGFRRFDREGREYYGVTLYSSFDDSHETVWLSYDNWDGFEVKYGTWPRRWDIPDQIWGALYGYYTKETLESSTEDELERRDDIEERWLEVYKLNGEIELATEDPEMLHGNVEFGLTLKQSLRELPFSIFSNPQDSLTKDNRSTMSVNSIEVDGQELTWVQSNSYGGFVILPEEKPAGSKLDIRMDFNTKALYKLNPSYSYVNRGGWMPFVTFGDRIDDFKLTMRTPSKYELIGIGRKVSEKVEGDLTVSEWVADSAVNFPTVIFGRYRSDKATFDAKKQDGKPIHVEVHVDDASFVDWGIAPKALREIAEQAVNSINLYTAMSGVDYPFGELNLVNDPLGFLYGQAPSSIIYLGSGVFKGEGELAPYFLDGSAISRFKKSVTAHEVGHQWWGNTVSNANERSYWFVESLAEYFSAIYLEVVFGWGEYQAQVDEWRDNILKSNLKSNVQNAGVLFGGETGGGLDVRTAAIYNKGPYAFHILRETFKGEGPRGKEGADAKFFDFLKAFTTELAAKGEIVTLDIQTAAERALGGVDEEGKPYTVDLDWFFDQWIRGSGIPQYTLNYDIRAAEDGGWIIEGSVGQQVMLGTSDQVIKDAVYRGFVDLTVQAKGGPFKKRLVVQAKDTPFALKVPAKPTVVELNKEGEMLAHDVIVR